MKTRVGKKFADAKEMADILILVKSIHEIFQELKARRLDEVEWDYPKVRASLLKALRELKG